MRGQPFPIAGALDDDLVAGVGQPVESAVAEDGIIEEAEPLFAGDRYDWSTLEWMPAEIFMWDSPDWIFVGDPKQCAVCRTRHENRISYMRATERGAERASVCSDCEYDANRKKDPLTGPIDGPIDSIEHLELVLAGDISARPWMTKSQRSRCPSSPQHDPVPAQGIPT